MGGLDLSARVELYGVTPDQLAAHLGGTGRARDPWRVIAAGGDPLHTDALPAVSRRRLQERCELEPLVLRHRTLAADGTRKLLLGLRDGRAVETVLIPGRGRTTVCVSSQVGCARGCGFCVTATMGLVRSLSAAEIVAQVVFALREVIAGDLPALRNVVYMGMGEPLDNLAAVRESLHILTHPHALGLGRRRITVSTVGTSPARIRAAADLPAHFAWSLHAADDGLRRRLIPTTRHGLAELREAWLDVLTQRDEDLFVEITLMHQVNDDPAQARAMAEFLRPLQNRLRINLLPMNAGRENLLPSTVERAEAYRQLMYESGYRCIIRQARGADQGAACGQLAVADGRRAAVT